MRHANAAHQSGTTVTAARIEKIRHPICKPLLFFSAVAALVFPAICSAGSMHNEITVYQGAKTCIECHDTAAREVMESLHYQLRGEPAFVEGLEMGKNVGMLADFSPLYHTVATLGWANRIKPVAPGKQESVSGCVTCHVGLGALPQKSGAISESDIANIDCLICHAPDYRRTLIKKPATAANPSAKSKEPYEAGFGIAPVPDSDILKAARQVKKPATGMCLRCHGSGQRVYGRPGIVGGDSDVHFTMGMTCTECHTTKKHKIAGGSDLRAHELPETPVGCPGCHTDKPHKGTDGALLNKHSFRIACQSCHIPSIARHANESVVTEIDWSKPKLNVTSGLYEPSVKRASHLKPEYAWWNRTMNPAGEQTGSKRDRKSRIYPWQRITCAIIIDATTGQPLQLHSGIYETTGDIEAAVRKGALSSQQSYSGKWKTAQQTVLLSVNHQVAPKTEALKCDDCHGESSRVDLKALGYGGGRR